MASEDDIVQKIVVTVEDKTSAPVAAISKSFSEATSSIGKLGNTAAEAMAGAEAAAKRFGATAPELQRVASTISALGARAEQSGTAFATLAGNYDRARAPVQAVAASFAGLGTTLAVVGAGVVAAGAALIKMAAGGVETARAIAAMQASAGGSTESLSELSLAFASVGVSSKDTERAIINFSQRLSQAAERSASEATASAEKIAAAQGKIAESSVRSGNLAIRQVELDAQRRKLLYGEELDAEQQRTMELEKLNQRQVELDAARAQNAREAAKARHDLAVAQANDIDLVAAKLRGIGEIKFDSLTTMETQVKAVFAELAKIDDPTERMRAFLAIFDRIADRAGALNLAKALGLDALVSGLKQGESALQRFDEARQRIKDSGLGMTEADKNNLIDLGRAWNQLTTVVGAAMDKIGAGIAPALTAALNALTALVTEAFKVGKAFVDTFSLIGNVIDGATTLVVRGVAALVEAVAHLFASIADTSIVRAALTAIGADAEAVVRKFREAEAEAHKFGTTLDERLKGIGEALTNTGTAAKTTGQAIADGLNKGGAAADTVKSKLEGTATTEAGLLRQIQRERRESERVGLRETEQAAAQTGQKVKDALTVTPPAPKIDWSSVTTGAEQAGTAIQAVFSNLVLTAPSMDWNALVQGATAAAQSVVDVWLGVGQSLTNVGGMIQFDWSPVIEGARNAANAVVDVWMGVSQSFTNLGQAIADAIRTGLESAVESVRSSVQSIVSEIERARQALRQLQAEAASEGGGGGGAEGLPFARGGYVRGAGTATSDSILARLSRGEFVVNAAATKRFRSLLEKINGLRGPRFNFPIPRFAEGGMVGAAGGLAVSNLNSALATGRPLTLVIEGRSFTGLTAPTSVALELEKFAVHSLIASAGRKPSWKR